MGKPANDTVKGNLTMLDSGSDQGFLNASRLCTLCDMVLGMHLCIYAHSTTCFLEWEVMQRKVRRFSPTVVNSICHIDVVYFMSSILIETLFVYICKEILKTK